MDKRRHKRIYVHLKAKITVDDQIYDGYAENVSESGIGYLMSTPGRFKDDFLGNKDIDLDMQMEPSKSILLTCVAKWARKGMATNKIIGVGMNIIDPPHEYLDWVSTLPG